MTRALLTGVTGQDGYYLARLLLSEGVEVHGVAREGDVALADLTAELPDVTIHLGDLSDQESVDRAVRDSRPDEVYNLAGLSSVAQSWSEPALTADVTGAGAVRVMQAVLSYADRTGREIRLLQASSAEIFGEPGTSPQDERTPLRPLSPYGAAKAFGHTMAGVLRSRGLHASTVILYNHESPRRPDTFVSRKITKAAAAIAAGSTQPLVLGNVDAARDWGYAADYVRAMRLAVGHDEPGDYVVATGVAHTVRDLVRVAFDAAGIPDWERHVRTDPALVRPQEAVQLVGDAGRARAVLGWQPATTFEELIALMVAHDVTELAGGVAASAGTPSTSQSQVSSA